MRKNIYVFKCYIFKIITKILSLLYEISALN